MRIQQGRPVSADAEEKRMAETHLAGEAGQQVPAGCKNGKDACQNYNPQQIRILCNQRKSEQHQKKDVFDAGLIFLADKR